MTVRDYTLDDLCDAVEKGAPGVLVSVALIFLFVGLLCLGPWIPFPLFHFWAWRGSLVEVLISAWPIFVWGAGLTFLGNVSDDDSFSSGNSAGDVFKKGMGISLWAGVSEEIFFRWLMFYSGIVGFKVMNFLTFGLTEWFHVHIYGPIANFFTLGLLHDFLLNGAGYAVGAAIITANGRFRNGHKYQGLFGLVNSWFLGMIFFYVMFKHGLLAAMLVHFVYDAIIFGTMALGVYCTSGRKLARFKFERH